MTDAPQTEWSQEEIEAARLDEENTLQAANIQFLQNRVVLLNLEVRKRDKELQTKQIEAERLRAEIAHLQAKEPTAVDGRRREDPDIVRGEVEGGQADTDM